MRIAYMGTPDESVGTLRALVDAGHEVVLVVSQPDRKRGRGGKLGASPVKQMAVELGLPVTHRMKDILTVSADVGVVVAFGRLIKSPVLEHLTWINLHPSLLPRWRGATPVESAILAGDTRSGVCVMQLEAGMDTGPVYKRSESDILPGETAHQLSDRLFTEGTRLLLELLDEGLGIPEPQVGEPTYAPKLSPEDAHLDWNRSAVELDRVIRLGRAWTTFRDKRFRVLEARPIADSGLPGAVVGTTAFANEGALELITVQPEGKGPQAAKAWANGARLGPEDRFS
jgi:methionyl-tRNA formyltransferase